MLDRIDQEFRVAGDRACRVHAGIGQQQRQVSCLRQGSATELSPPQEIQVARLAADQLAQFTFLAKLSQCVGDHDPQHVFRRRLGQIVAGALGQSPDNVFLAIIAGQHDHRKILETAVDLHPLQQRNAVQARHLLVEQHQIEAGWIAIYLLPGRQPVLGGVEHIATGFEHVLDYCPDNCVVINDQQIHRHGQAPLSDPSLTRRGMLWLVVRSRPISAITSLPRLP